MKEIKDKWIKLRVSTREKESIQEAADKMGISASEFIRIACEKLMYREGK